MAAPVEQEPKPKIPEEIELRPEQVEIPPEVERATGVQPRATQVTGQVTDSSGKQMMSSSTTQAPSITIPADPQQLTNWSTGSPSASLTWFASFWIRMIKKAFHFGWRIVTRGS